MQQNNISADYGHNGSQETLNDYDNSVDYGLGSGGGALTNVSMRN